MEKTTRNEIWKVERIEWWTQSSVFLNIIKIDLSNNLENKHQSKEDKLYLLEKWKYKTIKYALNSVESCKYNRDIINKEYNKIDLFYSKYGIDQKYLNNAKDFIGSVLLEDNINNKKFSKVMQLIYGRRFLVKSNDLEGETEAYMHMEIKKMTGNDKNKLVSEYNIDIKNITNKNIVIRHIDDFSDLTKMGDYLLEWKENIINKIPDYKDIDLVKSCAWFWDKDFIEWWKERRKDGQSNIIDLFEEESKYSYWLWKNERENWFWKKRINKESSLASSIEEYEKDEKPLAEWERIIDLAEMKKLISWNNAD